MGQENCLTLTALETQLRQEAASYLGRSVAVETTPQWVEKQVLRITGCQISKIGTAPAQERIQRLLAAQARWSRSRHPAYDLNRHITLKRLSRALATYPHPAPGNKKPATCG
jgi:hypothetical protein